MSNQSIRFTNLKVRGQRTQKSEKYTFLGYADATLVVPGALPDGSDLQLRFRGLQLKVVNGAFRFDFKSEKGRDGEWYPNTFPVSGPTRAALTEQLKSAYAEHLRVARAA